jgi:hypothetical protein
MSPDEYDNEHDRKERERFEDNVPDEGSGSGDLLADEPASQSDIDEYGSSDEGIGNPAGTYASEDAMVAATPDKGGGSITYSMSGVNEENGEDVSISPHDSGNEVDYQGPETADEGSDMNEYEQEERERFEANLPDEESASSEYIADEPASDEEIEEHAPSGDGFNNQAGLYADEEVLEAAAGDVSVDSDDSGNEVVYGGKGTSLQDVEGLGDTGDESTTDVSEYDRGTALEDIEGTGSDEGSETDEYEVVFGSARSTLREMGTSDEKDLSDFDRSSALEDVQGLGDVSEEDHESDYSAVFGSARETLRNKGTEDGGEYGEADMGDTHLNIRDAKGRFLGRKDEIQLDRDDEGNIVGYNPNTDTERVVAYSEDIADEEPRTTFGSLEAQTGEDDRGPGETRQSTGRDFGVKAKDQSTLSADFGSGDEGDAYENETTTDTTPDIDEAIPEDALAVSESGDAGIYISREDQTVYVRDHEGHIGHYDLEGRGPTRMSINPDEVVEFDEEGYEVMDAESEETIFGQTFDEYIEDSDEDDEPIGHGRAGTNMTRDSPGRDDEDGGAGDESDEEADRGRVNEFGIGLGPNIGSPFGNDITYNGPEKVNNQTYFNLIGNIGGGGEGSEEALGAIADALGSDGGGEGYSPEDIAEAVAGAVGGEGSGDEYSPEELADAIASAVGEGGSDAGYSPEDLADAFADAADAADAAGGAGGAGGDGGAGGPGAEYSPDEFADALRDVFEDLGPDDVDETDDPTGEDEEGSRDEPRDDDTDDTYDGGIFDMFGDRDEDRGFNIQGFNEMLQGLRMDEFLGVSSTTYSGSQVLSGNSNTYRSGGDIAVEDILRGRGKKKEEDEDDS